MRKKTRSYSLIALLTLMTFSVIQNRLNAQTYTEVTINTTTTSGGTWSGTTVGPYTFTSDANTSSANINVSDITDRLTGNGYSAGNVTIVSTNSSGSASGSGSIILATSLAAHTTSNTQLTLTFTASSNGSVIINTGSSIDLSPSNSGSPGYPGTNIVLTASGTGSVVINGAISCNGGNAGSGTNAAGGNAGNITLDGPGGITVTTTGANLTTNGGNPDGGSVNGNGGNFILITNSTGTISTTVSTEPGTGGTGGNRGDLSKSGTGTLTLSAENTKVTQTTLTAGALKISAGSTLTSNSISQSSGTLILESNSSGTANLISSATGISGTVERYVEGNSSNPNRYISSPLTLTTFGSSGIWQSGDYNMYEYIESITGTNSNIGWNRILQGNDMAPGKGYDIVCSWTTPRTFQFTGTLNNADVTISATNTSSGSSAADGWNLIGNPFPCAINAYGAKSFLNDNNASLDPSYAALYFWDDPNGSRVLSDYASINSSGSTQPSNHSGTPNGKIAVGQGFFIKVSANCSIYFKQEHKVENNSNQFFVTLPDDVKRFWLDAKDDNGAFNDILLAFLPGATSGFDPIYDAIKLKGNQYLSLYSIVDDKDLIIQGLPELTTSQIVSIGYDAKVATGMTFYVRDKQNFTTGKIYLKDLQENRTIDLTIDSFYHFNTAAGSFKNRFQLVFTGTTSIQNPISMETGNPLYFYLNGNSLVVRNKSGKNISGTLHVYSLEGKEIYNDKMNNLEYETSFSLPLIKGYYLVSVINRDFSQHTKILVP